MSKSILIGKKKYPKMSVIYLNKYQVELLRKWDERFDLLKKYRSIYGTTNVPNKKNENVPDWQKRLYDWVRQQRKRFKKNKLEEGKISKLLSIGFEFSVKGKHLEERFLKHYDDLKSFKEKYGHTKVPDRCNEWLGLGKWVSNQRYHPATGKRREMLDDIGFSWERSTQENISDEAQGKWLQNYFDLVDFRLKYGHTRVFTTQKDFKKLYQWTERMRYAKRTGKGWNLTDTQIKLLDYIEFNWNPKRVKSWEVNFQKLILYKKTYGHCHVHGNDSKYDRLCKWARKQRKNKDKLSQEQIEKLNSIGFAWDLKTAKLQRKNSLLKQ